jgi:hypothetical protein
MLFLYIYIYIYIYISTYWWCALCTISIFVMFSNFIVVSIIASVYFAGFILQSLLLWDPPHLTHINGLLQYDFEWSWQLVHCMILFLFTRRGCICMILFCNPFILYIFFLFSGGSKSTKNKFNGSFLVLCYAFTMFRTVCSSSNNSCFISSVFVELCRYLMTIL